MDSFGVVNPNSTIPAFQANVHLAYGTDGGSTVYRPMMPPPFQGGGGNGSPGPPQSQARKKRGRPRKHEVEGGVTVSPPPPQTEAGFHSNVGGSGGGGDGSYLDAEEGGRGMRVAYSTDGAAVYRPMVEGGGVSSAAAQLEAVFQASGLSSPPVASSSSGKKARGRPKGAKGRKQEQVADMGGSLSMQTYPWSARFTPHCLIVQAGEDLTTRIMSFSENGTRDLFVLSAIGAISKVTLGQATSGGTVTYDGHFHIIGLSLTYVLQENDSERRKTGLFSVKLAGPDHRVFGGSVTGVLIAATPVQVIFGCPILLGEDLKSPTEAGQEDVTLPSEAGPSTAPPNVVPGPFAAGSPISWGTMSDSSGGHGSPQGTRAYNGGNDQLELNSLSWLN